MAHRREPQPLDTTGLTSCPSTGLTSCPSTGLTSCPSTGLTSCPSTGLTSCPSTGLTACPSKRIAPLDDMPPQLPVKENRRTTRHDRPHLTHPTPSIPNPNLNPNT
ncbi:hypothetical protein QBC41DRAFT_72316 [Cercophora samala]|uniref:Uncharacterized protein n=1 Tax=Cercophora samala TaxID=330535 RepID=A0AA40DHV6_9PEZI|nr:hypothetical protein QBC41DRAFT_72316 [Cercophora samala]